ncbi:MAG TPA: DUF2059 domain-containing protein [Sphingomicrobium sp.]|nr:DUF2059 domain-containing protein [Sphingomicrobium sp.]
MQKMFGCALGAILATAVPANAAPQPTDESKTTATDPAALTVAHQILAIGFPAEKRSQMFSSVLDAINDQVRKSTANTGLTDDKDFRAILDRSSQRMWDAMKPIMNAALPDIFEGMARAYARNFSLSDLNALLAFVKTPAGQRFFERAPLILKDPDVQASQQRMMAQMMGKLPEMVRETHQDIDDYIAKKVKEKKTSEPKPVT